MRCLCYGLGAGILAVLAAADDLPLGPLDLNPFEDDDCLEVPQADTLLALMNGACDLLEQIAVAPVRGHAWAAFNEWGSQNINLMVSLVGSVLGRPYCEPGKLAWLAMECILLLRTGTDDGAKEAMDCAAALDEDLLEKMTPRSTRYATRMHMVLRSPWPALRLLDLLVKLHPENGSTRMGACRSFQRWNSDPDIFDWPGFKDLLGGAVKAIGEDPSILRLRPSDGPLSRQHKARWMRIYGQVPGMRETIAFSYDVFDRYREHHYKAGCHLGVISCYVLQLFPLHLRDIEGRLQRYSASVAQLINLHAPFTHMIRSDWPVFRLLYTVSRLQRSDPLSSWQGASHELRAPVDSAISLSKRVEEALAALRGGPAGEGRGNDVGAIYLTAGWSPLARFAGRFLRRWGAVVPRPLLFLAHDVEALSECTPSASASIWCIEAPRLRGVEPFVAKYLTLATMARAGVVAIWLDLDTYVVEDPTPRLLAALSSSELPEVVFARELNSESLSPAVVVARGSPFAANLMLRYACWLRENPFLLDHQGWDQFLDNRPGDFTGGFDYQGRHIERLANDTGPNFSFQPPCGTSVPDVVFGTLGEEFGSGDGWRGQPGGSHLRLFHFWGADETQAELFELFMPSGTPPAAGFLPGAQELVIKYHKVPSAPPELQAMIGSTAGGGGGRALYVVQISYADGCCAKAIQKNRRQALAVGVDEARAYARSDLDRSWELRNKEVLSQRRGGGWWLWKPRVILQTLRDPAVPWHRGVVLWLDAGNYLHADPRPFLEASLRSSDVVAMRLKGCLEHDWTNAGSLGRLNMSQKYALVDRPQLGAYFLAFRKTKLAVAFVEEWLRLAEDPEALLGTSDLPEAALDTASASEPGLVIGGEVPWQREVPGFQKHQADQSVFSLLFKEHGFRGVTLQEGHRFVTLARWRE